MQRAKRGREQRDAMIVLGFYLFFIFYFLIILTWISALFKAGIDLNWLVLIGRYESIQHKLARFGKNWPESAPSQCKSTSNWPKSVQVGANWPESTQVNVNPKTKKKKREKKRRSSDAWVRCCPPHPTSGRIGCRCDTPVAAPMLSRLTIRWIKDIKVHWEI